MTAWLVLVTVVASAAPTRAQTPADKLARGAAGVGTAFLEVPGNVVAERRTHGASSGMGRGLVKGLGMVVPRMLVGAFEVITAPLPWPSRYRPILEPAYPWSYFEDGAVKTAAPPIATAANQAPEPPETRPRRRPRPRREAPATSPYIEGSSTRRVSRP